MSQKIILDRSALRQGSLPADCRFVSGKRSEGMEKDRQENEEGIRYERLCRENFNSFSLDEFVRHQVIHESWRKTDGQWKLVPNEFEENWSVDMCREIAEDVEKHMESDQSAFGAFADGKVVGFITVSHHLFGTAARYAELVCFQVSESYRGRGIGRGLFELAVEEMAAIGAERLYISAHSSKESQAVYRALGCTHAEEINQSFCRSVPVRCTKTGLKRVQETTFALLYPWSKK